MRECVSKPNRLKQVLFFFVIHQQSTLTDRWVTNCSGRSSSYSSVVGGSVGASNVVNPSASIAVATTMITGAVTNTNINNVITNVPGTGSISTAAAAAAIAGAGTIVTSAAAAVTSGHHFTSGSLPGGSHHVITTTTASAGSITQTGINLMSLHGEPHHGPLTGGSGSISGGGSSNNAACFKYVVYKQPLSLDRFYIHDVPGSDGSGSGSGSGGGGIGSGTASNPSNTTDTTDTDPSSLQQSISSSTSNDWIRNNLPLSSQSSSSRSTLMDISNRMNLSISNNPIAKHNRSSYGRNSTSYNRSKTLNTSTISTSGVNVSIHYQSEIVMSIVEGRGKAKGEIGIAFIDLKSIPILKVSQFVDNYSLEALRSKCQVYTPAEIIFPHTMSSNNRMMSTLIESFPDIVYRPFIRKFFNEKRGFDIIRMLAYDDCQWIDLQLDNKYYCLAACSALFHYLIVVRQVSLSFSFDF